MTNLGPGRSGSRGTPGGARRMRRRHGRGGSSWRRTEPTVTLTTDTCWSRSMMSLWQSLPWLNTNWCDAGRRNRTRDRRSIACQRPLRPLVALLEDRTLLTPTLTTLHVSAPSLVYGQKEVLTAGVTTSPAGGATPSGGTVSFYDGST